MSDAAAEAPRTGVRSLFPGYYPPSSDDLKRFVTAGLVVLDTNALLDVYRFTEAARTEYFQALSLLGDRLWIPHRTAQEFFDRRTTVIRSRRAERTEFDDALNSTLEEAIGVILRYAKRRGLSPEDAQSITALIEDARQKIQVKLDEVVDGDASIDPDCHPDIDPILQQIEEFADGKIGTQPSDPKQQAGLEKAWQTRLAAKIPPGYEDAKKGDRSIGDYLVWHQTLEEAKRRRSMPILMISNEQKPDWVRRDGTYVGPRPELVKEMRDHADQDFHLVDVHTFLTLANEHLSARISKATVDEASRLSDDPELEEVERLLEEIHVRMHAAGLDAAQAQQRYIEMSNSTGAFMGARLRQQLDRSAKDAQYAALVYAKLQQDAARLSGIADRRRAVNDRTDMGRHPRFPG